MRGYIYLNSILWSFKGLVSGFMRSLRNSKSLIYGEIDFTGPRLHVSKLKIKQFGKQIIIVFNKMHHTIKPLEHSKYLMILQWS